MKVMCISDTFFSSMTGKKAKNHPLIGEVVTVLDVIESKMYVLSEYPKNDNGKLCAWVMSKFIPLSDIDETELIKERELINA